MKILLSDLEVEICKKIAIEHRTNDRNANIKEKKLGPGSAEEQELHGVCAEFVVAKILNLFPDFTTTPRKGGYDLITHDHKRIDVKQTIHLDGNLIAPFHKKIDYTDIYVLVIGTNPYEIVGWCFSKELINDNNIVDFGYGKTYCLPKGKLRNFVNVTNK